MPSAHDEDKMAYNWTCPFCNRPQSVTKASEERTLTALTFSETRALREGTQGLRTLVIKCANPTCKELTIFVELVPVAYGMNGSIKATGQATETFTVRPAVVFKTFPDYIPAQLRSTYQEACATRTASPMASATLARRCLQGMLRDFCQITGQKTLYAEIETLIRLTAEGKAPVGVHPDTVDVLHKVRSIGNIGAHMEQDVNLIIPIDEGEAQRLIALVELLMHEWYVGRHVREQNLKAIVGIADDKKARQSAQPTPPAEGD